MYRKVGRTLGHHPRMVERASFPSSIQGSSSSPPRGEKKFQGHYQGEVIFSGEISVTAHPLECSTSRIAIQIKCELKKRMIVGPTGEPLRVNQEDVKEISRATRKIVAKVIGDIATRYNWQKSHFWTDAETREETNGVRLKFNQQEGSFSRPDEIATYGIVPVGTAHNVMDEILRNLEKELDAGVIFQMAYGDGRYKSSYLEMVTASF